eukprot:Hpha_TRINITY_DN22554_c0_g1::TRINITY_DN22554_c0_g1_i1::g.185195::m.185195
MLRASLRSLGRKKRPPKPGAVPPAPSRWADDHAQMLNNSFRQAWTHHRSAKSGQVGGVSGADPQSVEVIDSGDEDPVPTSENSNPRADHWTYTNERRRAPQIEMDVKVQKHLSNIQDAVEVLDTTYSQLGPQSAGLVDSLRSAHVGVHRCMRRSGHISGAVVQFASGVDRIACVLKGGRRPVGVLYVATDHPRSADGEVEAVLELYKNIVGKFGVVQGETLAALHKRLGFPVHEPVVLQCGDRRAIPVDSETDHPSVLDLAGGQSAVVLAVDCSGRPPLSFNIASLALTAHTLGLTALVTSGKSDPPAINDGALHPSGGVIEYVDVHHTDDMPAFLAAQRAKGAYVVGAVSWDAIERHAPTPVQPLSEVSSPADQPLVLVLGGEAGGLSMAAAEQCDVLVTLRPSWTSQGGGMDEL